MSEILGRKYNGRGIPMYPWANFMLPPGIYHMIKDPDGDWIVRNKGHFLGYVIDTECPKEQEEKGYIFARWRSWKLCF